MHDQDDLQDSIKKHLDDLNKIVGWALLLAVAFWWAGYSKMDPIKSLGMVIEREYALYVAVAFYVFVNFSVLERLFRLYRILKLLDDENFEKGISKLFLHSWILNPFSYFGDTVTSRVKDSKGFGLLIFVWWICNSSLYALADNYISFSALLLQGLFLGLGLITMGVINLIFRTVLQRLEKINPENHKLISKTSKERGFITFLGIFAGATIAFWTMFLIN